MWMQWSSRRAGAVPSRWRPSKPSTTIRAARCAERTPSTSSLPRACALLIPVGGFYTIDAETAKRVADAIAPRVIVPMHYRHGSHGYDVIATVEDFLRLYPADEVHCLDGSSFELTPDAPRGVIVPRFMG